MEPPEQFAVKVFPKRPMEQCYLWDCQRGDNPYCSTGHELLGIADEEIARAVVVVDSLDLIEQDLLSHKVLVLKSVGECCGIPRLESDILNGLPWEMGELDFIPVEDESSRAWVFISDNTRPGEIWMHKVDRTLQGITLSTWCLFDDPPFGIFKLRKYTTPSYNGAIYWVLFTERTPGSWRRFGEPVVTENASPMGGGGLYDFNNISGLLFGHVLHAAHLTMNYAEESQILVDKLSEVVEDLTAKVTAWEDERGNEFLYDGYKTLWEERELEKQRQRDQKKLHGQLITEQEALYGSKPSPNNSGKKPMRTPVTAAVNRKLSLGGAMLHQSLKPEKATLASKRTNYCDENASSSRNSTLPTPSGKRKSGLLGRLRSENLSVAGKAPMLRKPLSPLTSKILNSPEDHKDACTAKPYEGLLGVDACTEQFKSYEELLGVDACIEQFESYEGLLGVDPCIEQFESYEASW